MSVSARLLVAGILLLAFTPVQAQFGPLPPVADMEGVTIREVARFSGDYRPVRIARDPVEGKLYVLATRDPDRSGSAPSVIYRLEPDGDGTFTPVALLQDSAFGAPRALGMAFGPDGTLYVVGNEDVGSTHTRFVIQRGRREGESWVWENVATSEPYLLSHTWFDHRASGIIVSPDGSTLLVNSGSRTDHGEMYGGVREEGLTALILKIPANATNLVLPNDRQALKAGGYVYAEGTRNTFDFAYAPNGDLFGLDNAGDRDDSEELNWLREGQHYGFPWRIGTSTTPMQFEGYDPDQDPFVQRDRNTNNLADTGWYFSNDPTYPDPPEGVVFVDPIPNVGPYADRYRDETTGEVVDASETGTTIGTFTAHRSPLGLVFDADSLVAEPMRGGGFMLSFNSADDQMLARMGDTGEDLVFLDFEKVNENYTVSAHLVAHGFVHPIDAVMVENTIYVLEYGSWNDFGDRRAVWAVTLPRYTGTATADGPARVKPELALFPNPAADHALLTYRMPRNGTVQITLLDLLGRVVLQRTQTGQAGRLLLPTRNLSAGVYLLRLESGTFRTSRLLYVVH